MSREMINILGILITHPNKRKIVDWGWIIPRRCPFLCPKLFNLFQFVSTRKLFFSLPLNFLITVGLIATNWLQTFLLTQVSKGHKIPQKICSRAEHKKKFVFGLCGHRRELFAWKLIKSQDSFDRKCSHILVLLVFT